MAAGAPEPHPPGCSRAFFADVPVCAHALSATGPQVRSRLAGLVVRSCAELPGRREACLVEERRKGASSSLVFGVLCRPRRLGSLERHDGWIIAGAACRENAYFHVLAQLMRLRQACSHPALVRSGGMAAAAAFAHASPDEIAAARSLSQPKRAALLEALVSTAAASPCAECGDVPDEPLIGPCRHLLCRCRPLALAPRLSH